MSDVSTWTLVGQIFVFYLVAFPILGILTHAVSWIVYCWQQPGEGYAVAAVRGLKGGYASEAAWKEAVLHGDLDEVLDRVATGGCPKSRSVRQDNDRASRKQQVDAACKKAEAERDVLLLIDTACTPGTNDVYGKFKIGGWYRRRHDGLLMRLEEVDPQYKIGGRFRSRRRLVNDLFWLPAAEFEQAQPQVGEWWRFLACKQHGNVPQEVKVADNAFWKQSLRQEQLSCGCLAPSNFRIEDWSR